MTHVVLVAHSYSTKAIELLIDSLGRIKDNYKERRAIKRTEDELYALTEKELLDIGICRGDIYSIARSKKVISRAKGGV